MDGVSMRAYLRNQFYQLLKKEDDSGLFQRMRNRLEKARQTRLIRRWIARPGFAGENVQAGAEHDGRVVDDGEWVILSS